MKIVDTAIFWELIFLYFASCTTRTWSNLLILWFGIECVMFSLHFNYGYLKHIWTLITFLTAIFLTTVFVVICHDENNKQHLVMKLPVVLLPLSFWKWCTMKIALSSLTIHLWNPLESRNSAPESHLFFKMVCGIQSHYYNVVIVQILVYPTVHTSINIHLLPYLCTLRLEQLTDNLIFSLNSLL